MMLKVMVAGLIEAEEIGETDKSIEEVEQEALEGFMRSLSMNYGNEEGVTISGSVVVERV